MDSGVGSDDEKRNRTKAQKQLQNEQKQLFSSCFIDATSLGDEESDYENRCEDERRQGALIFQSAIPQYSMLQMSSREDDEEDNASCLQELNGEQAHDTSTPHNSMVHVDVDTTKKTPIRFYVDLGNVESVEVPSPEPTPKKNIFSMTIDFNAPKREMPSRLNSSLYKNKRQSALTKNVFSSSVSSLSERSGYISDSSSNHCSEHQAESCSRNVIDLECNDDKIDCDSGLCDGLSITADTNTDIDNEDEQRASDEQESKLNETIILSGIDVDNQNLECMAENCDKAEGTSNQQFVKLSDLKEQRSRPDLVLMPRMSRSIPETSWLESPLAMLHSAGYRTTPRPFQSRIPEPIKTGTSIESTLPSKRCVRKLGTDLLRMFLEEINTDITLDVNGRRLRAHRCILSSRCQYFAAVLSGNASIEVVPMEGYNYTAVHFALCHIYSGAQHIPDSISTLELAALADMLGLEGLKEVVSDALQTQYCHDFHKPCAGCINGVPEILPITSTYGLDELYQSCLSWITKYYVDVWPNRMFSNLPREFRDKCYQQHIIHMAPNNLLETILTSGKLLATMPTGKWAEPIAQLALQLSDHCQNFLRQHYATVLVSSTFAALNNQFNVIEQLEISLVKTAGTLKFDQACQSLSNCYKLIQKLWSIPFSSLLHKINAQIENCLARQANQISRSNVWMQLEPALKKRIRHLHIRYKQVTPLHNNSKTKLDSPNLLSSSSDSSRNSSPITKNGVRPQLNSPSLRKSLLLAARSSQTLSSPTTNRRISTLTKPTQSSVAKSSSKTSISSQKVTPSKQAATSTMKSTVKKITPSKVDSRYLGTPSHKVDSKRVATPSKVDSKREPISNLNIKNSPRRNIPVTNTSTPIKKANIGPSSKKSAGNVNAQPKKMVSSVQKTPNKQVENVAVSSTKQSPMMRRSDTFLKEEPTVLGKM